MTIEHRPEDSGSLRANLLGAEPVNADRLRRLQQQIAGISEHRLTPLMRIWWIFGLASAILFAGFGGFISIATRIDVPLRVVWCLYTSGNLFVAVFAIVLLRRGRAEPRMFFYFGIVIVTLAVGCFVSLLCRAAASSTMEGVLGAGLGGLCVLVDLILILYGRIAWAHLATKEHLLRLELLILDSKAEPR
jgi:hypothetical protein